MEKHADLMEGVSKGLSSLKDTVTDPKVLPYLISGGAGAGAGAFLTARTPERPGEDRSSRRKRILRNAALLGGTTAGAHKLIAGGVPGLTTPKPPGGPTAPQAALEGISSNPTYYTAAGGGLAAMIARMAGKEEQKGVGTLLHNLTGKAPDLKDVNGKGVALNKLEEMINAGKPMKSRHGAPITDKALRDAGINGFRLGGKGPKLGIGKGEVGTALGKSIGDPGLSDTTGARRGIASKIKSYVRHPANKESLKLFGERVTGVNRGGGAVAKRLGLAGLLAGLIPQGISRATRAYDPAAFVDQ